MPTPTCPKCKSERVKPVTIWSMFASGTAQGTPAPIFACQEPLCLHKWTRPSEAICAHTIQRLTNFSVDDAGRTMAHYFCEACGTEVVRPYEAYQ